MNYNYHYHLYDLPDGLVLDGDIAVDTEAMGLNNQRDRLCVVQISNGNGDAHIVHFPTKQFECINLKRILADPKRQKIFHFARFDIAILQHYLDIQIANIFCTKIASRLCRTYTDNHGLKNLCHDLLGIKLSKQERTSDWGAAILSQERIEYAGSDVLHLHKLRAILIEMLKREGRIDLAHGCFEFLQYRASLDLLGWNEVDIFAH